MFTPARGLDAIDVKVSRNPIRAYLKEFQINSPNRWPSPADVFRHRVSLMMKREAPAFGEKPKTECARCKDHGSVETKSGAREYCTCAYGAEMRRNFPDALKEKPNPLCRARKTDTEKKLMHLLG